MEKIAEVLYALHPDTQPWDGDPYGFHEALRRNEFRANLAVKQAKLLIALGVVNENDTDSLPSMWEVRSTLKH